MVCVMPLPAKTIKPIKLPAVFGDLNVVEEDGALIIVLTSAYWTTVIGPPRMPIVRTSVALSVLPGLVALIVTLVVAAAVGVPVIAPVLVSIDRPFGSPVAL